MNLQNFVDFGAEILINFGLIPDLLLGVEILGTPLWVIVLGSGLGIYLGWIAFKFAIGLAG